MGQTDGDVRIATLLNAPYIIDGGVGAHNAAHSADQ